MTKEIAALDSLKPEIMGKIDLLHQEAEYVKKLIDQQLAYGTKRVYQSDWRIFDSWCIERNYQATNATSENISMFIGSQFKEGVTPFHFE